MHKNQFQTTKADGGFELSQELVHSYLPCKAPSVFDLHLSRGPSELSQTHKLHLGGTILLFSLNGSHLQALQENILQYIPSPWIISVRLLAFSPSSHPVHHNQLIVRNLIHLCPSGTTFFEHGLRSHKIGDCLLAYHPVMSSRLKIGSKCNPKEEVSQ